MSTIRTPARPAHPADTRAGEACDCDGCREFRAVHARHCPEVTREKREAQRRLDGDAWRRHQATTADLWGAA